jgi:hypothetical protein
MWVVNALFVLINAGLLAVNFSFFSKPNQPSPVVTNSLMAQNQPPPVIINSLMAHTLSEAPASSAVFSEYR